MFGKKKSELTAINSSINLYKSTLMKDINLKLRLTDEHKKQYTTILDSWNDNIITFIAPLEKQDWVIFYQSDIIECSFITKQSLYTTSLKLIERTRDKSNVLYKAQIISLIQKKQQRAHFRLETLIPLTYTIQTDTARQKIVDTTPKKGISVNISAGGICLVCYEALSINQEILVSLELLDTKVEILCQVLGVSEKSSTGTYGHRIKFIYDDPHKEQLLSKLIIEKQRLSIRNQSFALSKKH
ncbi:MAG: flagellar brake protein [Cellulosilyticaceae bacterium]